MWESEVVQMGAAMKSKKGRTQIRGVGREKSGGR